MIHKILDIISDYRQGDLTVNINKQHIERWVSQFEDSDREFLLAELAHILPQCYLSKQTVVEDLNNVLDGIREYYKYNSVEDLLDETIFLKCQEPHKSQPVLISFLNDHISTKYNRTIDECGLGNVRHWLYLDDVLASGGTYKKDIINKINEYGKERFMHSNISIINLFFYIHTWGESNCKYRLKQELGCDVDNIIKSFRVVDIQNDPRINWFNQNPSFNCAYPLKSKEGEEFLSFIDNAFERSYPMNHEKFAFRDPSYPKNESFFSSPENRDRYETIILSKGIEIIKRIDTLKVPGIRPLGITPPSYKTLGTGSHCFTWRNISNTCPLVYWWESNNWYPLFPVQNRGQH